MNLVYSDLTRAWESINELLMDTPKSVIDEYQGVRVTNALYLYNVTFTVLNPVFDPNFDFGRHFNYSMNKWRTLVSNYVCLEELEGLRDSIAQASITRRPYSIVYSFKNTHKNGKGCLLNILVTRRYSSTVPYVTFYLRASETTKRLSVDLLLAQRIGSYLFGDAAYRISFHIDQLFNDDNVLLMYHAHKDIRPLLKRSNSAHAATLLKKLNNMLEGTESKYCKYKVHFRAFKVLRPDLYVYPVTLAKDCNLPNV